jgi:Flp pilus assembly protein TadB
MARQSNTERLLGIEPQEALSAKADKALRKNTFYRELTDGSLGISLNMFVVFSIITGGILCVIYYSVFPSPFVLGTIFLNGMIIPYVIFKQKYMKSRMDTAMRFREFLEGLTSEFIIGSSTTKAIENILKMKNLLPEIRISFNRILNSMKLGTGVIEILRQEKASPFVSKDLKIVLSVLIINHDNGSSDTIKGLNSVGLQMKDRMDNLVDLKKSMAGINSQRYIFFVLVLTLPLLLGLYRAGFFAFTLKSTVGVILLSVSFLISFVGQIVIDSVITKTTNKF